MAHVPVTMRLKIKSYVSLEVCLHALLTAAVGGYKRPASFFAHCDHSPARTNSLIFDKLLSYNRDAQLFSYKGSH